MGSTKELGALVRMPPCEGASRPDILAGGATVWPKAPVEWVICEVIGGVDVEVG